MHDWLQRMFDPSGFTPRWHCGDWSSFLGWLHIGSDIAIWLAYMGIPALLLYFTRRRPDVPLLPAFWLFMAFITACGVGHLADATMFWWPAYRFDGALKLITAVVSIATLIALFPLTRRALALPGTRHLLARLRDASSAHHRSQAELQFSQEQLRMATMTSGVGLWTWHAGDDHLAWDGNTCRIFGLGEDVRSGDSEALRGTVHPDDEAGVTAALRDSMQNGAALALTFRILRRNGTTAHVVARGAAVRDDEGRIAGLAGAFFDVTEDERSRALFHIAVDASPNALLMVDRTGAIVLANPQAEAVFGYSRAELLGMNVDRLVPRSVEPGHAALRASFHAEPSRRRLGAGRDLAGRRKNGDEVPVEVALAPVQLQAGPGVLAAIVDITDRKALERKLSQAERLAAVGELAAGVAHEINNPVNTIVNCAQLVLDGDPAAENCKVVLDEGMRIAAIVRDLLQFARDDRDGLQPTSVPEAVGRCLRLVGDGMRRHGICLHVDVPADLPLVNGQPQQLQQVVLNLLTNAKDAVLHGQAQQRRIEVVARTDGDDFVHCRVRDNGPGVPDELRERIFEPFVTTKRSQGGTGLGLSVSRNIIAGFGGTLSVDSVVGEFAEFTISLRRATLGPSNAPQAPTER